MWVLVIGSSCFAASIPLWAGSLSVAISPNLELARVEGFHLVCGHPPLTVDFASRIEGAEGEVQCAWDFDGNGFADSASIDPPPVIYDVAGVYNAAVIVRDAAGRTAESSQRVVVIESPRVPDWRFGLVAHLNRSYGLYGTRSDARRAAGLIRELNVDVVRCDLAWSAIQPTADACDWSEFDDVLDLSREFGFELLPIVGFSTQWASTASSAADVGDWFFAAPEPAAYAWFAHQAAARYAGLVRAWEIWSEPNTSLYWRPAPDPVGYTELLKRAYLAVKYADPSAVVVLGGLANEESRYQSQHIWCPPEAFLQSIYDQGGGPYFDVVARHPYTHPDEGAAALSARLWDLRMVMEANGDAGKPIWLTEIGYSAAQGSGVTEERQSQWLGECFEMADPMAFLGPLFWYNLRDTGSDLSNWGQNLGLIAHDWALEPDFESYRALISERGCKRGQAFIFEPPRSSQLAERSR